MSDPRLEDVAVITADAARAVVGAALDHGAAQGCPIVAAVVDSTGTLVAFLRAAGAPFPSSQIAQDKAYTAAAFRMPSHHVHGLVSGNPALREGFIGRDRIAMFGGGLPVRIGGVMIGAVGVSGGSEEFDLACARVGLQAIGADAPDGE
jgi:uncharacterized protein GlcG (DUF336 family)